MKNGLGPRLQINNIAESLRRVAVWSLCLCISLCLIRKISVCIDGDMLPDVRAAENPAGTEPAPAPETAGEGMAEQPEEQLVVVIDPGHGGEEEGGMYDSFIEKDMTLITAKVFACFPKRFLIFFSQSMLISLMLSSIIML